MPDSDSTSSAQETEGVPRPSRRNLLTGTAAAVGTALVAGTAEAHIQPSSGPGQDTTPWNDHPVLVALGLLVLPTSALDSERLRRTLQRFASWADGFEPVAELDHRYLSTDEIPYGPPDPRPLWRAQLEALETEAQKRHLTSFVELAPNEQRRMATRAIERSTPGEPGAGLPRPERAAHVAVALIAWFFASSDANDLCHGKRIGRHECRGMRGVDLEPRPLPGA